jgi:hypothetical protein
MEKAMSNARLDLNVQHMITEGSSLVEMSSNPINPFSDYSFQKELSLRIDLQPNLTSK